MAQASPEDKNTGSEQPDRRPVRSFVLRAGRLTDGQKRALDELWPIFRVPAGDGELALDELFGNARPVILEIGFGNGEATWRMARAHPEENYLGVEVHKPGVGRLLLKIESEGLGNVRIACEDAVGLLSNRIADESLSGVRIYFPDPWPKKRHHKRRLIQAPFIDLLASRIQKGCILHLATDWEEYAEHMLEVMHNSPEFKNLAPDGRACSRPEWRPETKYEKRGERLGHEVFDLIYQRAD
jgi:tRNA (guanine-N7-)-methyltransferase